MSTHRIPVYNVDSCPLNKTAWNEASLRLNCSSDETRKFRYHCMPNQQKTSLMEFCYDLLSGRYLQDRCIRLSNTGFLNHDNIYTSFSFGCPAESYLGDELCKYPACLQINPRKGCFLADPKCPSHDKENTSISITTGYSVWPTFNYNTSDSGSNFERGASVGTIIIAFVAVVILVTIIVLICIVLKKRRKNKNTAYGVESHELSNGEEVKFQFNTNDETDDVKYENVDTTDDCRKGNPYKLFTEPGRSKVKIFIDIQKEWEIHECEMKLNHCSTSAHTIVDITVNDQMYEERNKDEQWANFGVSSFKIPVGLLKTGRNKFMIQLKRESSGEYWLSDMELTFKYKSSS